MRVLNVFFDDRFGGPQKRAIQVAGALRGHGVETILCLPVGDGHAAELAEQAGIPVRRIAVQRIPPPRDWQRVLRWAVHQPGDVRRFVSFFRRERPDVVHVNGAIFLAPALAAKLARVPLVWHLIDTIVPSWTTPFFGALLRLLANQIVASSEAVAVHYRVASTPHAILYPPVDIARSGGSHQPTPEARRDVYRVGLVGNWNPTKGVEHFVQAAALVREQLGDRLEVVFAGARYPTQAGYCARVNALIERLGLASAIRDHGFVADVEVVLKDLDLLVSSSVSEAFGMSLLEAMVLGVPVVGTDVGGIPELLLADPARPAGIVVPPREPAALARAILDLYENPAKAAEFAANGRALAPRFSLENCAQRHLEVYSGTLRA